MKNSLYKLPFKSCLPVLEEPDQQVVWSKNEFEEGVFLLYLQDFDLREENLNTAVELQRAPAYAMAVAMSVVMIWPSVKAGKRAQKELKKTGKIKGHLFLTPDFKKVWLSHYDIKYLDNFLLTQPHNLL